MMTRATGRYDEHEGQAMVRFERVFPHPVGTVWAAVTEREQLERWFPTTVEMSALCPGAAIVFRFPQDAHPPMRGEILTVTPERALSFTWGEDTLSFVLEPVEANGEASAEACRLTLTVVMPELGKAARDSAGWDSCLDTLATLVAGERRSLQDGLSRWQAYYDDYQRLGLPATAPLPNAS